MTSILESQAKLNARLDRIPIATRSHKNWIFLLASFYFLDQFDIAIYSYTAPAMKTEWGLELGQIALAASTPFVGMFVGALIGGRLADVYGRRPVIIYSVMAYSALTGAIFLASNIEIIAALRGLAGIGLQALVGAVIVFISETFPKHLRGRYLATMLIFALTAAPVAGVVARIVVPLSPESWQYLYLLALLGIPIALLAVFRFPESPRWLIRNGRAAEAEGLVTVLEEEARRRTGKELPEPELANYMGTQRGSLRELLERRYVVRLVVSSVVFAALVLVLYGFTAWLPTLLTENGATSQDAILTTTIVGLFIPVGAIIAYPIIDRFERKTIYLVSSLLIAASLVTFVTTQNWWVMIIAGAAINALLQTCMSAIFTYMPEVFPTHLRGIGSGVANGVGRLAGFGGSYVIAAVFAAFGFNAVFYYLAALATLSGIVLFVFGTRTTNRRLEDISAPATESMLASEVGE